MLSGREMVVRIFLKLRCLFSDLLQEVVARRKELS